MEREYDDDFDDAFVQRGMRFEKNVDEESDDEIED
jgi:hypothetical protein